MGKHDRGHSQSIEHATILSIIFGVAVGRRETTFDLAKARPSTDCAHRAPRGGLSGACRCSEGIAMSGGITALGYGSQRVRRLLHRQVAIFGWRAPPRSERIAAETEPDLRSEQGVLVRLLSWLARWTLGHRHPRWVSSMSADGPRQARCTKWCATTCRHSTLRLRMGLRHRCPRSCATSSSVIWIVESYVEVWPGFSATPVTSSGSWR